MVGPNNKNQYPLCVHCLTKLKQSETDRLKTLQHLITYCNTVQALQLEFNPLPVSTKIPKMGDITLNHYYDISNSNIGLLNAGTIQAELIDVSMEMLIKNNQENLADVIKQLTDAVIKEQQINDANKTEVLEAISFIAEESVKPPQYRKKTMIMEVIEKMGKLISVSEAISKMWDLASSVFKEYFS